MIFPSPISPTRSPVLSGSIESGQSLDPPLRQAPLTSKITFATNRLRILVTTERRDCPPLTAYSPSASLTNVFQIAGHLRVAEANRRQFSRIGLITAWIQKVNGY